MNPSMQFIPISKNSVDGECIPRTPLIASRIFFPRSITLSIIPSIPFPKPFLNPSIMLLPMSLKSKSCNLSKDSLSLVINS